MAQFTVSGERAEAAVSAANPAPLALGVFAFTTAILGSIFAGFIVPGVGAGVPSLGIFTALGSAQHAALGLFFLAWTIFSAILFLSSLRANIGMIVTLALLFLSYLLLTMGELAGGSATLLMIGGWLGVLTGLAAWYNAFAGLLNAGKGMFHLPT